MALSEKRAQIIATARAGKRPGVEVPKTKVPPPFALSPTGPPVIGLMWKNLIAARATRRKLAWTCAVVLPLALFVRWGPLAAQFKALAWGIYLLSFAAWALAGGGMVSNALRRDLGMLDVLKVYPLPGWQLVLGELLGPALVAFLIQGLLAAVVVLTVAPMGDNPPLPISLVTSGAIGALLVVLPLYFVSAIVPGVATLLFPAWAKPGKEVHQPGFEAIGQRMVFGLAQLAALLVALAPAVGVGLAVFIGVRWIAGPELASVSAGLFAGAVLAVEAAFGVRLLGRLYDRYDASAEQ